MAPATSTANELAQRPRGERVLNKTATAALRKLVKTRRLDEALGIVEGLVTQHKFSWRPVGDRENNYGSINIGSDPGHAFIERVTNAIDAVIEREALRR